MPEADKLERLFGRAAGTPASRIGRYCSLNLRRLTSYGTFEVRRFHGTLDPAVAVCWAHFCAAFVECFRGHGLWARLLGAANHDDAPRHGQSALGRRSPCGHTQLQKPRRSLRAGPWVREECPRRLHAEEGPRWGSSPTSPPLIIQALAELVAAQEAATPAGLMAAMAGYVDAGTADYLMRDSGAQPR